MPIYEFKCIKCGNKFEDIVSFADDVTCPQCCCSDVEKLLSTFAARSAREDGSYQSLAGNASCSGCTATSCAGCQTSSSKP